MVSLMILSLYNISKDRYKETKEKIKMLAPNAKYKVGDLKIKGSSVYKCCKIKPVHISQDEIDDGVTGLPLWSYEGTYYEIEFENITSTPEGKEIIKKWNKLAAEYNSLKKVIAEQKHEISDIITHLAKDEFKVNGWYYDKKKEDSVEHFFSKDELKEFYKNKVLWIALDKSSISKVYVPDLSKTQFEDAYDSYDINDPVIKKDLKEWQRIYEEELPVFSSIYVNHSRSLVVDKNNILYYLKPAGFYGKTDYDIYTDKQPLSNDQINRITKLAETIPVEYIRLENLYTQLKKLSLKKGK